MLKRIIKRLLIVANVFFALGLFAVLLAGKINPHTLPYAATWALLFPYLLIINAIFFVLWALKRKIYLLISAVVMLLSFANIGKTVQFFAGTPTNIENTDTLKILSYNTMSSFGYQKYTSAKDASGLQYILDQDADVVLLQEFSTSNNNIYLTEKDINHIFKKYKYKYIWHHPHALAVRQSGMAILSKYRIVRQQEIDFNSAYNGAIYADIKINDSIYRFFNLHLESNKITAFDNQKIKEAMEKQSELPEVAQFLTMKLSEAAKIRTAQVELVAQMLKDSPHKNIVCGDFNDVPVSHTYNTLQSGLKDAFTESGKGLGLTFSHGIYQLRIDYILYNKALKTSDFTVDKVPYSDHFPVHCKMYFPK
ncbi:MAG: endonuclease/exonuclease/phosphatase family protein [Prevotellaceae bacterium]|jgi:endonuclease/exonuclease/phosphatase family metal-dependent hydrolase|nr:endonuclease/exonuclease/phosphatase family protein [Prevotellaceae bacterium]